MCPRSRAPFDENEFWAFLNGVDRTMLYNTHGDLEGLPDHELEEIFKGNIKVGTVTTSTVVMEYLEGVLALKISEVTPGTPSNRK